MSERGRAPEARLAPGLVEQILERLGCPPGADPDLQHLARLYGAWCQSVPFDNVRKLIHVRGAHTGPLPGDGPTEYFEAWLKHGCGGTCWAGNGALHALLTALGFSSQRGVATMLASPNAPPGHGTVVVDCEGARTLLDASMLHGLPLRLMDDGPTHVEHAAWGVRCGRRDGRWHVTWRPLHRMTDLDCRIEHLHADRQEFHDRHEATRSWSPFNFELMVRVNRGDAVVGTALGARVVIEPNGQLIRTPLSPDERRAWLIEGLGLSEELVMAIPPDIPTPPPPAPR
jgi:N-hydroxyarylamine O-acetyltransferase